MDTQNNGLEKVIPFQKLAIVGIYVRFQGCNHLGGGFHLDNGHRTVLGLPAWRQQLQDAAEAQQVRGDVLTDVEDVLVFYIPIGSLVYLLHSPSNMGPSMNLERICEHRDVPLSHIRNGASCVVDFM